MIPVTFEREYGDFDRDVRQKGRQFLNKCPNPNSKQYKGHHYWIKALTHLHDAYNGLCAYTTRQLVYTGSVDHFLPKSRHPHLAYEWSNYRLARQEMNRRKGDSENIVDPFQVGCRWFVLDLPSCLVKPGWNLRVKDRELVEATIETLRLNKDDKLVDERHRLLISLADGDLTLRYLEGHYPFLAHEVVYQGVEGSLRKIFALP